MLVGDSMVPGPTESTYLGKKAKLAGQFQDYSMYEMIRGEIHALYTVENQSDVDPQMVLRHAGYEGAAYRRQYGQGKAAVQTRPEGQAMPKGQTMPEGYGMLGSQTMPEGREVYPVISLVLNWGEERWTAATAIQDLIGYPVHRGAEAPILGRPWRMFFASPAHFSLLISINTTSRAISLSANAQAINEPINPAPIMTTFLTFR